MIMRNDIVPNKYPNIQIFYIHTNSRIYLFFIYLISHRFWVEPDSGLPLDVSSKFQINMALGDISMISNTKLFSNMYLPMLWFDIVSIIMFLIIFLFCD